MNKQQACEYIERNGGWKAMEFPVRVADDLNIVEVSKKDYEQYIKEERKDVKIPNKRLPNHISFQDSVNLYNYKPEKIARKGSELILREGGKSVVIDTDIYNRICIKKIFAKLSLYRRKRKGGGYERDAAIVNFKFKGNNNV